MVEKAKVSDLNPLILHFGEGGGGRDADLHVEGPEL